jgi:hypothetical protein
MLGGLMVSSCSKDEYTTVPDKGAPGTPAPAMKSSLPHTNLTNLTVPVDISFELTTFDCSNNPGPQISFEGFSSTSGFGVRTIFRNNEKGTHQHVDDTTVNVNLLSDTETIVIPKQPVLGGVGGNPFIWIQFEDDNGNPLSDEIFIGRCVQNVTFKGSHNVDHNAVANVEYTVDGCSNSPGPEITFDAGISLDGLNAVVIFRNNDNPVGGPHQAQATFSNSMEVIPSNTSYTFPKQPVHGGVGGNPWIWTQFIDGSGGSLSDEILLGRCVQISK